MKEKSYVYVINHAFGIGGESIAVLKYDGKKSSLKYITSLRNTEYFDKKAMGSLNDLAVTKDGELYVSNWKLEPSDRERADLDKEISLSAMIWQQI